MCIHIHTYTLDHIYNMTIKPTSSNPTPTTADPTHPMPHILSKNQLGIYSTQDKTSKVETASE